MTCLFVRIRTWVVERYPLLNYCWRGRRNGNWTEGRPVQSVAVERRAHQQTIIKTSCKQYNSRKQKKGRGHGTRRAIQHLEVGASQAAPEGESACVARLRITLLTAICVFTHLGSRAGPFLPLLLAWKTRRELDRKRGRSRASP